uniref:Uncharacterized protein n=1 Tax=Steinernema glaseri TaxID=37863 RepID=A0A1I7YXI1_9BILA
MNSKRPYKDHAAKQAPLADHKQTTFPSEKPPRPPLSAASVLLPEVGRTSQRARQTSCLRKQPSAFWHAVKNSRSIAAESFAEDDAEAIP